MPPIIISARTSAKVSALSFLCAMMIVPIHCMDIKVGETTGWLVIHVLLSSTLVRCAVPFFFICSGYFMFASFQMKWIWWQETVFKRTKSLLIPYIIWNCIYYMLRVCSGKYDANLHDACRLILGLPLGGELACGQFWYVRCILMYAFVSPIFAILSSLRIGAACLLVLLVLWMSGIDWNGAQAFNVSSLLFFSIGVFVAFHGTSLRRLENTLYKVASLPLVVLIVAVLFRIYYVCCGVQYPVIEMLSWRLVVLAGLHFVWFGYERWLEKGLLKVAQYWRLSFFIYASHVIFVSLSLSTLAFFFGETSRYTYGGLIALMAGIVLPIVTGELMRRSASLVYKVMTGGRL